MADRPFVVAGEVMVRNEVGEYLFLQRSSQSHHFMHKWEVPGGKMEPGETLEDCLVRETKEETGLDVSLKHVMGASEGEIPTHRIAYVILSADIVGSDDVTLSDEHDNYMWATLEQALGLDLCPAFIPFFQSLISR